ncbi:MAG: transcriptional repressor [Muribaculaceae bacterium]|nr:transcriptional repressor [Muribaculaceae bacterium]MDE6534332.1 transcriptional repressor [Muribaculaceae bacterium]
MNHIENILEKSGIKPTSNRILVLREILKSDRPLSLMDLDSILDTLDKSSISRVLTLLLEHGAVHAVEDGRGITRYETCNGDHSHEADSDMHAHFYCERCHKVFCLEDIPAPSVPLPAGFTPHSVNYMVKGFCPECSRI